MKWREPWKVSLKQQPRFNLLGRDVLRSAATWTAVLVVVCLLASLGEARSVQVERLANLWIAPLLGIPLASILYVIRWLSPRKVDSGPRGIVISKSDHLGLVPWIAIQSYGFTRSAGHDVVHITDQVGNTITLFLADNMHPKEVESELVKMTGKHPNNSFKGMPLRGTP